MDRNPAISIIMPTYNYGKYIGAAVDSVLAQTFGDWELLVIDDGSDDDTADRIGAYQEQEKSAGRIRYLKVPHGGVAAARNAGLREARGQLICFLDSDDRFAETKLEKELAYLEAHPEEDAVFSRIRNYTDIAEGAMSARQEAVFAQEDTVYFITGGMFRAEIFREAGLFQEDIQVTDDTEWLLRCRVLGHADWPVLPEVLYFRRVHDANISFSFVNSRERFMQMMSFAIRNARKQQAEQRRQKAALQTDENGKDTHHE